jgi:hypothetical protein
MPRPEGSSWRTDAVHREQRMSHATARGTDGRRADAKRRRDAEKSPRHVADVTGKLPMHRPGAEIEIEASEGARTKCFPESERSASRT